MRLVSSFKYIITFKNSRSSKFSSKYSDDKNFMFFPTPPDIDSMCGWCIGSDDQTKLKELYSTLSKEVDVEAMYQKGENGLWTKM